MVGFINTVAWFILAVIGLVFAYHWIVTNDAGKWFASFFQMSGTGGGSSGTGPPAKAHGPAGQVGPPGMGSQYGGHS